VGVTWQSDDLANYYYGTLKEEVARGVVNYTPDAVTVPHIGFSYFRPIGEKGCRPDPAGITRMDAST